ncbi:mevalonate kinase [Streptomyces sp. NPDC059092]|uniref:mevalonate kinase n=1 Tax=Streptomyces sp. NPDC059092 TaxID=3346725 RepID=UPI003691CA5C
MSPHHVSQADERRVATGRAHGKIILLGEHAVVYGAPALALPVPALSCQATAGRLNGHGPGPLRLRRVVSPPGTPAETTEESASEELRLLVDAFARRAGLAGPPGLEVLLESGVPPARGLGSSAATARALVHALDRLFGTGLSDRDVFELVQVSEQSAHGRASGIDALATGGTGPVLLADGRGSTPPVGAACHVVVVDTGSGSGTGKAVAMLRDLFTRAPGRRTEFLDRSTELTRAALGDLANGRLPALGRRLTVCHTMLAGLGLTTERTDATVRAALDAGALGAKMTGGGLGGCVIALAATRREAAAVAALLTREQGVRTWHVPVAKGAGHDGF